MPRNSISGLDFASVRTPAFVVDTDAIRCNCEILADVQKRADCTILLALKGFAMFGMFPLIRQYLTGTCASGVYEARLGYDEFGGEVHVYSPAYTEQDMQELLLIADHLVFNSFSQWQKYRDMVINSGRDIKCGIRINPEYSEVEVELYNPCAPRSRLGVTRQEFRENQLDGITGLHFHTHCEQNSDALEHTLEKVTERFGDILPAMQWVNFGGGHHITRPDYDIERLVRCICSFRELYDIDTIYLEPGEAVALHAGVLVSSVIDIIHNEMDIVILDTSATAHMPDVLEMPYRPEIAGAGIPGKYAYTYRLGGLSCLAGDIIGDYSFKEPLKPGDKLIFLDMAHYSMVKTTMFNGVRHPSIITHDNGEFKTVREFTYEDFKHRLG
jgi:carboxynorspermidine decarboxylase